MTSRIKGGNRLPGSKKCEPGCKCLKHKRSDYHNMKIGESVKYAYEQKKLATKSN